MRLELRDNPALEFYDEYNLNVDPLRMDLLIIHKPSDVKVDNQIGDFCKEGIDMMEQQLKDKEKINPITFMDEVY